MRVWAFAVAVATGLGICGAAVAQQHFITERREGMREMGRQLEAINAILQSRGDQRPIAERADRIISFYGNLNSIYPAASLTPPVSEGRSDGHTRALGSIETSRAVFTNYANDMVRNLTAMKAASASGGVTPDMLRAAGQVCAACHNQFRAR